MPDGDGPVVMDLGPVPIRLDPDDRGEVVWCDRIDPARAVIRSVPLVDSGRRWGDCVLHDGVPTRERVAGGRTFAVFDELELWEPAGVPTLRAKVEARDPTDSEALVGRFIEAGFGAEDWTSSIRMLCKACSEGRVHQDHDPPLDDWQREREFGLAAPVELARELLEGWVAEAPERRSARDPEAAA